MTAAAHILARLFGVRRVGDRRWVSRCPAHDDRSPSLSIRQADDRVLLRCWAGCETTAIVATLGMTLADLFDHARYSPSAPAVDRRHLAATGLEKWRSAELLRCGEELRLRDVLLRAITRAMQAGAVSEAAAWDSLGEAHLGYSALEYRFERLLRNQDTLKLWRESRRTA